VTFSVPVLMRRASFSYDKQGTGTMPILASQEERNLKWSDYSSKLKLLMVGVIALVFLMAIALFLGIEPDGGNRLETLVRGLLGQGDVKSDLWLWVSRLSVVGIVASVVMIRKEQGRVVEEKRAHGPSTPA
jgi:hypothetical protein